MDWRYNTIWYEQLPVNTWKVFELKPGQTELHGALGRRYVSVDGFKPRSHSLTDLVGVDEAIYFYLVHSNIRSFDGIANNGPIKRLETHHCVKLEDGTGLLELRDSLEWLHINTSKKFCFPDVHHLKNLKVLCLNSCGALPSLDFLYELPGLVDFRFVNTVVMDGDLTPLVEHPSLVSAGFLNKRHYNLSDEEVKSHLAARNQNARIYAYNGQWETYRYRGLGDSGVRSA